MKTLIHQPLLHFFALGAALFVLFGLLDDDAGRPPGKIVVDAGRVSMLASGFERTWQRPPTPQEMEALIDGWVREEVLYREGVALGLDRDDPVVRRRIAQRIEFMSDIGTQPPDEAKLAAWLADNPDRYRAPPKFAFEQVLFSPDRHGADLPAVVQEALDSLKSGATDVTGAATLLPGEMALTGLPQIARTFGDDFAAGLADLPIGEWAGPLRSGYGLHVVLIKHEEPAYIPSLEEVRSAVERDLLHEGSEEARNSFYQALRDRYTVVVEAGPQLAGAPGRD